MAPERKVLQALIDESQTVVNGHVTLKLYKGSVSVLARSSDDSLYDADVVTFEDDQVRTTNVMRVVSLS